MSERLWEKTEPGILGLLGTDFKVQYEPGHPMGDFHAYQGDRSLGRAATLAFARWVCERRQEDIDAIA